MRAASHLKKAESPLSSPMPERRNSEQEPSSRRSSRSLLDIPSRRISTTEVLEPHAISPVMEDGTPDDLALDPNAYVLTQEDFANLPWHAVQLYKLYGKKADDYLHPKMEHKTTTNINPKLRRQGGKTKKGRAGADVLWDTLREDSKLRLLKEDTNISQELKAAYGAFVRQSLHRHRVPVKRNFYVEEDVPDIARLMDQSVIKRTQDTRHKVELMFRSSVNNEDRAKILNHNNPIPDFNNIDGEESIDRYLPSWAIDEASTEHSYKKWVRPRLPAPSEPRIPSVSSRSDLEDDHRNVPAPANNVTVAMETVPQETEFAGEEQDENGDLEEWDFMLVKRKSKPKQQKIHFVKEQDLSCKGQFSKRVKEKESSKGVPTAFDGPVIKSQTARDKESSPMDHYRDVPKSMSAPPLTHEEYLRKYTTTWEPLSMNALMEYKEVAQLFGDEDYRQGRTRMWSAATTS